MSNQSIEPPEEGLLQARRFLRDLQAEHPTRGGAVGIALDEPVLDSCLANLNQRRNFQPTDDPEVVERNGIRLDRKLEERRIALAENLIRRVDPGPFEDPVYLALIAYQAASIEMALPDSIEGKRADPGWSRFLIGTIHSSELNAFAQRFDSHGYTVVALYSALIEFAYQAAKAVVAAQNPTGSSRSQAFVTTNASADHVAAQLERNQEPVERLYRTLEAYFFNGYPRAFAGEIVPVEHVLPLTHLIGMAERWIIAHEYGHGLAATVDWTREPAVNPGRAEEFFADNNATILTAMSAVKLDGIPPEFALIGGTFALACLEIFQRGLSVVCCGKESSNASDADHPPNKVRAQNILDNFDRFFDLSAGGKSHGIDLRLVLEPHRDGIDNEASRVRSRIVFQYPNTLLAIWGQVRPRLMKDFENGRILNPMWS